MRHIKIRTELLALAALGTFISCDTTSAVHKKSTVTRKSIIRNVRVPYKSEFWPSVVNNMPAGSLEDTAGKSYYKDIENINYPAFGCTGSWANPDKTTKYYYYTNYLYFPESIIKSTKGRYKYLVTKALSPKASKGKVMGITRCIVPYIQNIDTMLNAFLRINGNKNNLTSSLQLNQNHGN